VPWPRSSGAADVEAGLERMPPRDALAEQSVLGGMLLSKDAIADVAEVIQAADSYSPTHEMIFGAILDLFAREELADPGLPTVIFSLEMSRTEITTRLLSAEAAIKLQALRTGRLAEDDWTKIARVMGRANDAPLFIDDSRTWTWCPAAPRGGPTRRSPGRARRTSSSPSTATGRRTPRRSSLTRLPGYYSPLRRPGPLRHHHEH
jgi:hypothetical protein